MLFYTKMIRIVVDIESILASCFSTKKEDVARFLWWKYSSNLQIPDNLERFTDFPEFAWCNN